MKSKAAMMKDVLHSYAKKFQQGKRNATSQQLSDGSSVKIVRSGYTLNV